MVKKVILGIWVLFMLLMAIAYYLIHILGIQSAFIYIFPMFILLVSVLINMANSDHGSP